ncbi:MAG: hypothetical protein NC299_02690 [Lachnospiraceae bacterium]|nr:hypothetical protein [Ruminococcus sp.]MCM1274258.1 hypothetical protein [Lachnospiraceae bacterium]
MVEKITNEQRGRLRFRQKMMREKLTAMELMLNGRGESYFPLIKNEDGAVDPAKLERFASDMVDSLKHYLELDGERRLSEESERMYGCFLFCAVTSLRRKRSGRDPSVWEFYIPSVYQDIIDVADADIEDCGSYEDFLALCYELYRGQKRRESEIFYLSKFTLFMGDQPFIASLPYEVRTRLCRDYARKYGISEEENQPFLDEADEDYSNGYLAYQEAQAEEYEREHADEDSSWVDEWCAEEADKYLSEARRADEIAASVDELGEELPENSGTLGHLSGEEIRRELETKAEHDLMDKVFPEWHKTVICSDDIYNNILYENFTAFAKLFFSSPDRGNFYTDVVNMVDTYLYEHGISAFSLKKNYGMVNYRADLMIRQLKKEIERGRGE